MRSAGDTHRGKVRPTNEDNMIVEPRMGLYAVLDGMGGANAGDVASQLARDTIRDFVMHRQHTLAPAALLESAIVAGSTAVFTEAQEKTDRHGMGTTVVACLIIDANQVVISHVGDSRAYLLRDGRLQPLTRDHTIVEELAERGLLTPEEAERHPYKNVLSRNLGAKPEAKVDTLVLDLKPGDRLLLCSDGLYGFASAEAIQYVLGSGDDPKHVARDLIDLALRGGGGDNVSTIVIETSPPAPSSTQVVRTSGARTWWQHRQRFLEAAHDGGLPGNAIVRGLPPHEALELVALSLCQAIYHDLEKSTGVNVWTFAQNLAAGWFERGGDWDSIRGLVDILGTSAHVVVGEIRAADQALGFLIDVAVSRALIVVELALGGLLAERLRQIDADLVELYTIELDTSMHNASAHITQESIVTTSSVVTHESISTEAGIPGHETISTEAGDLRPDESASTITAQTPASALAALAESGGAAAADRTERVERPPERISEMSMPTIPFLRPDRPVGAAESPETAEVLNAIAQAMVLARGRISPKAKLLEQVLIALDAVTRDSAGNFAAAVLAARELYGTRSVDNVGVMPLFDGLDQARILVAASVHQLRAPAAVRVGALRSLSTAHQRLVSATTGLVLEAVAPFSDRLREAQVVTGELRDAVAKAERQRAELERRFATIVDSGLPWGARGTTEW